MREYRRHGLQGMVITEVESGAALQIERKSGAESGGKKRGGVACSQDGQHR